MEMINISGAVSLYLTEYKNKRYYFFGDVHGSFKGGCADNCQLLSPHTFQTENEDQDCVDISKFIDLVCRSQERYNQWATPEASPEG